MLGTGSLAALVLAATIASAAAARPSQRQLQGAASTPFTPFSNVKSKEEAFAALSNLLPSGVQAAVAGTAMPLDVSFLNQQQAALPLPRGRCCCCYDIGPEYQANEGIGAPPASLLSVRLQESKLHKLYAEWKVHFKQSYPSEAEVRPLGAAVAAEASVGSAQRSGPASAPSTRPMRAFRSSSHRTQSATASLRRMCGASLPTMHQARASATGRQVESEAGARYCGGKHNTRYRVKQGPRSLAGPPLDMPGGSIAGAHERCACPSAAAPGDRSAGFTAADVRNTTARGKEGMASKHAHWLPFASLGTQSVVALLLQVLNPFTAMTPAEFRARFTTNLGKPEPKASGVQVGVPSSWCGTSGAARCRSWMSRDCWVRRFARWAGRQADGYVI